MNRKQAKFLKDMYKAGFNMILLPPDGKVPETKFEVDVVYVTRLQKERM